MTHPLGSPTTGVGPTRAALIAREHAPPLTATPKKDHGDTIVPQAPPTHPDLRDAAAKFDANAALAQPGAATHATHAMPSGTTSPKGSDASKQGIWLDSAGDFAKGMGEGAWDGASGMVQGVGVIAKGAYHLATSADARSQAADSIAKGATAAGKFAMTAVTDPAKAASQVTHAANNAADSVSTAYHHAAANGHGSEFFGKIVGQGAVLAATLPFGGAEAESAAAVGDAGRIAEAAADLRKGGDAATNAGKAPPATDAAGNVEVKSASIAATHALNADSHADIEVAISKGKLGAAEVASATTTHVRDIGTTSPSVDVSVAQGGLKGQHTLARHVNDTFTKRFKNEPNITRTSTYTDLASCQRSIDSVVGAANNQSAIAKLLENGAKGRLQLDAKIPGNAIGRTISRVDFAAGHAAESTNNARVVLTSDTSSTAGYTLLTSFPTEP